MSHQRKLVWLGLILLAGLTLRLIMLSARPIWYDDAFSLLLARRPWGDIIRGTAADTMPPLYYFMLSAWQRLGDSIAWDRLLNVLLGLGLILAVYLWLADLLGEREGLWAALFVAVAPLAVYHAQELRMYTLLALAVIVNWYAFGRLCGPGGAVRRRWAWWAVYVGSGVAAMYTHNLAVFSLLVPDLFLLIRRQGRALARLAGFQGVIAVLSAPWLVYLPGQIGKIQTAFWTPVPGPLQIIQAVMEAHTFLPLPGSWIPAALVGTLLVLALTTLEFARTRDESPAGSFLLMAALATPVILFGLSYVMRPLFVARAFFPSILAYFGLIGWAVVRARNPWVGRIIAGLFVAGALAGLWQQYAFASFPRPPFGEAAAWLQAHVQPGDRVINDNKLSDFPLRIYAPDLPMVFIADAPGSANDTLAAATQDALGLHPVEGIDAAAAGANRVWFVTFQRAQDEYQALGQAEHPSLAWLDDHYARGPEVRFNDLLVFEFDQNP